MEVSYKQIYRALMSEGIEEYVPDGVSLSHPVPDLRGGRIIDCFLLFSTSRDGSKYTVPTARILIDSERKALVDYKTTEERPFDVYDGSDYYNKDIADSGAEAVQNNEMEYQEAYISVRKIAFKEAISTNEREILVRYIKSLKRVELIHLQPYLFELGQSFFEWAKSVLTG